jgi:hypothetical protein
MPDHPPAPEAGPVAPAVRWRRGTAGGGPLPVLDFPNEKGAGAGRGVWRLLAVSFQPAGVRPGEGA